MLHPSPGLRNPPHQSTSAAFSAPYNGNSQCAPRSCELTTQITAEVGKFRVRAFKIRIHPSKWGMGWGFCGEVAEARDVDALLHPRHVADLQMCLK